jgi:hypothetical protein
MKGMHCEECGREFENLKDCRAGKRFCSDACRSRAYYKANRERLIAKAKA